MIGVDLDGPCEPEPSYNSGFGVDPAGVFPVDVQGD